MSRHSCEKLGIVSKEFPKVGEHLIRSVNEDKKSGLEINVVERSGAVY